MREGSFCPRTEVNTPKKENEDEMLKSKLKASALVIAVLFPLVLSGCSSESSKVTKACGLVEQGATGLKAGDDSYTDYYAEAATILNDLAAKDSKYSDPYEAALLWASGDNLDISDLELLITLEDLCAPDTESDQ
jgi:hypothetical protein